MIHLRIDRCAAVTLLLVLLFPVLVHAEMGPAETVVVINRASPASAEVAHRWCALRKVPADQIIELDGIPLTTRISLEDFRRLILTPVETILTQRQLAERTLLIAYGPDFPTAVTFPDAGLPGGCRSPGSLTGLTLLAPLLDAGPRQFTAPDANTYADLIELPRQRDNLRALKDPRLAQVDQLMKDKDHAAAATLLQNIASDIPAPIVLYNLACLQALAGKTTDALATLGAATDAGWFDEHHTRRDADLKALHHDPAWEALLKRIAQRAGSIMPGDSIPFHQIPGRAGSPPGRLAILLAVTSGRGLTVAESITNLERSVAADGTRPTGTVWFMASSDQARTGPRRWAFTAAASALRGLGITSEVQDGTVPPNGAQVIGATIGVADFDWAKSGATMLAGAWCDHLTSFGGALEAGAGQTPLTAFLRAGAAGAGGTVAEPLNHPFKFPSAFVHLHRARGLSLVEAVYRSMSGPYQYLVVGDPLSRPWPQPTATQP
jgi:hypothetical protein